MEKYNEKTIYISMIIVCVMFISIILIQAVDVEAIFNDNKKVDNSIKDDISNIENISEKNDFLDVSDISQGSMIINLPNGIVEKNTSIYKDLINKKIYIQFPKGVDVYDFSNVVNNTSVITEINHSIENDLVNIELNFSCIMDCKPTFEGSSINLEFFRPCDLNNVPVIVLDPGHGDYDVGASSKGINEKDIDLQISNILFQMLENDNIVVYYTRLDDSYPTVEERADFVNEIMPDMFISIHANWGENPEVSGVSVLYNKNDTGEFGSMWLSQILLDEIVKSSGLNNNFIDARNDIHIIRSSKVPVALIETGFMSNSDDFSKLTDNEGQIQIARGIYNGIISALAKMSRL